MLFRCLPWEQTAALWKRGYPFPTLADHGGRNDVLRVVGAQALRTDVLDAGSLDHRTDCAAGDDSGAFRGGLKEHAARAELADDLVRYRRALERDGDDVLLRTIAKIIGTKS